MTQNFSIKKLKHHMHAIRNLFYMLMQIHVMYQKICGKHVGSHSTLINEPHRPHDKMITMHDCTILYVKQLLKNQAQL